MKDVILWGGVVAFSIIALAANLGAMWLRRKAAARANAINAMYASILPGEDPRMVAVAMFYGLTLDDVRARIARGARIGRALGHTLLLFPPASPRPPARDA